MVVKVNINCKCVVTSEENQNKASKTRGMNNGSELISIFNFYFSLLKASVLY